MLWQMLCPEDLHQNNAVSYLLWCQIGFTKSSKILWVINSFQRCWLPWWWELTYFLIIPCSRACSYTKGGSMWGQIYPWDRKFFMSFILHHGMVILVLVKDIRGLNNCSIGRRWNKMFRTIWRLMKCVCWISMKTVLIQTYFNLYLFLLNLGRY